MVGVKGQAPLTLAALGIAASVALQKRLSVLCCLLCTQCFCLGALAFHWPLLEPQWAIRWAIETSQTPSAVIIHSLQSGRDSLKTIVCPWLTAGHAGQKLCLSALRVGLGKKAKNSHEEFAQSLLQKHNLCLKCLMATKQITGSDGVIGSAVIPEWFSHAVLRRRVSFLNFVSFPLTCMYYFCPQTPPAPCTLWTVYKCMHNLIFLGIDAVGAFTGRLSAFFMQFPDTFFFFFFFYIART